MYTSNATSRDRVMESRSVIFLGLAFSFLQFSMCLSVIIDLLGKTTFLPDTSFCNNTAPTVYQCIDICSRFQFCKSINFIKEERRCMLNYADTTTTRTIPLSGSHYVEKEKFPALAELLPKECLSHKCSEFDLCVTEGSCYQWRFVSCGPPEEDPDAIIQFNDTMVFSKASYECRVAPRSGSGFGEMQCSSNGKWTDHGIRCPRFVDCGPPPDDPAAIIEYSSTITYSIATYRCKIARQGQPRNGTMECFENTGSWTDHGIICARFVDCGPPPDDPTAITEYSSTITYSLATYRCKRARPGQPGNGTMECSENTGSWTDHGIICADACFNPPFIRAEQRMEYQYERGTVNAQYSCQSFPDPSPTQSCPLSVCTQTESWASATLSCSPQDCFDRAGYQYSGHVSCTVSGRTCQRWDVFSPQFPLVSPSGSDRSTNYCRPLDNEPAPWCYTTDPDVRWEFCPIQDC